MRGFSGCLLACLLACCAGSRQSALSELSQARLARAQQLQAEKVAPQSFQHFRAASTLLQAAKPNSPERADRASEARLWLEAAISEAEQLALSRERLELERQAASSDERYLASEQQRLLAEQAIERHAAGAIALLEAERSLARAALLPAQRIKLAPAEVAHAAAALLTRAELVLLSAGDDPTQRDAREQVGNSLKEARAALAKNPDRALELADRVLFSALALLAPQRATEPAVSAQQRASLVEALQLAGATVQREDRGLKASLPKGPAAERTLARLCSVALAYPQGQVQLAHGAGGAALGVQFGQQGCQGARFSVTKSGAAEPLSVTFSAY